MAGLLSGRAARLDAYFDKHLSSAWAWGASDCCMFAAGWFRQERGFDPIAAFRGAYEDEPGAVAILERAGGLLALFADKLDPHCERTLAPQAGDIGLAELVVPGRGKMISGAICARGGLLALKAPKRGLLFLQNLPLCAAWKI